MIVTLVMALSADGVIGKDSNHFPDWTGKADKKLFVRLSKQAGVVIMGSKTFDTIDDPLPNRKNVILTRNKHRISKWDNLIFTDKHPTAILSDLAAEGYAEAVLAGGAGVNTLFAKAECIDYIVLTVSPIIFGQGLSLFSEAMDMNLELETMDRIETNLVCLKYKVIK